MIYPFMRRRDYPNLSVKADWGLDTGPSEPNLGVRVPSNDHPRFNRRRLQSCLRHGPGISASGEGQLETKFWRYEISNLGR